MLLGDNRYIVSLEIFTPQEGASSFAEHDVNHCIDIADIDLGIVVHVGATRVIAGLCLAKHDVDDDVHIAHIHLVVAIDVATHDELSDRKSEPGVVVGKGLSCWSP